MPFLDPGGPGSGRQAEALCVEAPRAGRAQRLEVLTQAAEDGRVRVWLPVLDGTERLGLLSLSVDPERAGELPDGLLGTRLRRFAALAGELVMTKTLYGDTIVRLRRRAAMGLAAELQWTLLPPLTFACDEVTVAAALEPASRSRGTPSTTPWTPA